MLLKVTSKHFEIKENWFTYNWFPYTQIKVLFYPLFFIFLNCLVLFAWHQIIYNTVFHFLSLPNFYKLWQSMCHQIFWKIDDTKLWLNDKGQLLSDAKCWVNTICNFKRIENNEISISWRRPNLDWIKTLPLNITIKLHDIFWR